MEAVQIYVTADMGYLLKIDFHNYNDKLNLQKMEHHKEGQMFH